ncbi:MAG: hypothetical protein M1814_003756 [Vezdaea aestivalis]|nr:MAG: hypothetical protein M1814_003756 [Vezdaea aestivalis]
MADLDYAGMASGDPVAIAEGAVYAATSLAQLAGPMCQLLVDRFSNRGGTTVTSTAADGSTVTSVTPAEEDSEIFKSIDTEPQRRAYETVNYVLRNFGCRITEMQLIDATAMNRALANASEHIEVRLFSPDMNLLFRSLQSRLNDVVLLQSVFASIYFLGALCAELTTSLPNWKESYPPIGPHVVGQFFRAAIGDDAYRQDQFEKDKAFATLAATAGLLRPTDIGYSIFPGGGMRSAKSIYDKLKKHFERHGFPQPLPGREVGGISDWSFLSGDANNRVAEVEKADKHIGENFGRVIYWLICSAARMPVDRAVIVYHDQHKELVKFLSKRAGIRVLTAVDLDMSSNVHSKLDTKAATVLHSWVLVMAPLVPDVIARPPPAQVRQSFYIPPPQTYPTKPPLQTHGTYPVNPSYNTHPEKPYLETHNSYPPQPNLGMFPAEIGGSSFSDPNSSVPPAYSPQSNPTSPASSYSIPITPAGTMPQVPQKQFTIRRKAPPAPKPVTFARALYDFTPEVDDTEGLAFRAGEVLEITDKNSRAEDGWWLGRVRGSGGRIGCVPESFLTVEGAMGFT